MKDGESRASWSESRTPSEKFGRIRLLYQFALEA
jgi:hypothetical protein